MEKYDLSKLNKVNKYEVEYIDYELIVDSKFYGILEIIIN